MLRLEAGADGDGLGTHVETAATEPTHPSQALIARCAVGSVDRKHDGVDEGKREDDSVGKGMRGRPENVYICERD